MAAVDSAGRMVRAKVVMLGAPGVGKTSLVRRFVHSVFSDEYRSTLGVKVDRKIVAIEGATVTMLLWDIHGEAEGLAVPDHYLKGATGCLAVFDSTRTETLAVAAKLRTRVHELSPHVVSAVVANKADLNPDWGLVDEQASEHGVGPLVRTSAKLGDHVDETFEALAIAVRDRSLT